MDSIQLGNIGLVLRERGEREEAVKHFREALALYQGMGFALGAEEMQAILDELESG